MITKITRSSFCSWILSPRLKARAKPPSVRTNPEQYIGSMASLVFSALTLLMAITMLPQDLIQIAELGGPLWGISHVVFRIAVAGCMIALLLRAFRSKTTTHDFYVYLGVGVLYSIEGSLFNASYYLAFIQIMFIIGFFSTLPLHSLVILLPISGVLYSIFLLNMSSISGLDPSIATDYLIAAALAICAAIAAGSFRDFWQEANQNLLQKELENNSRMIDLGQHLGSLFHDVNNSLAIMRTNIEYMREHLKDDHQLLRSIERLSSATSNITRLQQFVLGMSRHDKSDIQIMDGASLQEMLTTVVHSMCPKGTPHLNVHIETEHEYFCSPPAIVYSIVNLINNSVQCFEEHKLPINFTIDLRIYKDSVSGNMVITVRDNGPGFPADILAKLFTNEVFSTRKEGHGIGLRSVLRYVQHQGGKVNAFNDGGAVIQIEIPQDDH